MSINCCLLPSSDGEDRNKEKRNDNDGSGTVDDLGYMQWLRNKSKEWSHFSTSEDKVKNTCQRKECWEDAYDEERLNARARRRRRKKSKKKNRKARTGKRSDSSFRSERAPQRENKEIFREQDLLSVTSDPGMNYSLLAESFYSDDSLGCEDTTLEADYATSTPLFEALEVNDWGNVLFFLRCGKFFSSTGLLLGNTNDNQKVQARTWVHCRDDQGNLLWRQLPLHAAICQEAPLVVVQRLVETFPESVGCYDSFGNLPVQLAAKIHGRESTIYQFLKLRNEQHLGLEHDFSGLYTKGETVGSHSYHSDSVSKDEEQSEDEEQTYEEQEPATRSRNLQYNQFGYEEEIFGQSTPKYIESSSDDTEELIVLESRSDIEAALSQSRSSWERPRSPPIGMRDYGSEEDFSSASSEEYQGHTFDYHGGDEEGSENEFKYKIYDRKQSHSPSFNNLVNNTEEVAVVDKDTFELYYYD